MSFVRVAGGIEVCLPVHGGRMSSFILREQEDWFEDEIRFVRTIMEPDMVVVDVGANLGMYTLSCASLVGPGGRVFAFEPASSICDCIRKSVERNRLQNIQIIQAAVSDHDGQAELAWASDSELNTLAINAPLPSQSAAGSDGCTREAVQLVTLDSFAQACQVQRVDFLKLDAEGEEKRIIQGAQKFLTFFSPLVLVEIKHVDKWDMEAVNALQTLGYRCYQLLPELNVLIPFDSTSIDPFQLNVFLCKSDTESKLIQQGRLVPVTTNPAVRMPEYISKQYLQMISNFPYWKTVSKFITAEPVAGRGKYEEALQWYCFNLCERSAQESAVEFANRRVSALFNGLSAVTESLQQMHTFPRFFLFVRISSELGFRGRALEGLERVAPHIQTSSCEQVFQEPILPILSRFDSLDPGSQPIAWCSAAVLEQKERLSAYSSFFNTGSPLEILESIHRFGFPCAEMERRRQLLRMLSGLQNGPEPCALLSVFAKDNLNPEFWSART
eukprot:GILJ01009049.1.p1 GENE.GILJ01009049.1~~GILJ01009049.1.p1  ORF type:complete len:500 (+),score=88.97 GILJ01009049.1:78-1577(+)